MAQRIKNVVDIAYHSIDGKRVFAFEDLIRFLRRNNKCGKTFKTLRTDNILRELRKYGVLNVDSVLYVPICSFLRFIYNHHDDFDLCERICAEIEEALCQITDTNFGGSAIPKACGSNFELYQEIARSSFFPALIENYLLSELLFPDSNSITSLQAEHEIHFTVTEWKKITLFEWHFSRSSRSTQMPFERMLAEKWNFYTSLCGNFVTSSSLQETCEELMRSNALRRNLAEKQEGITFGENVLHIPSSLEGDITNRCNEIFKDLNVQVICLPCHNSCTHFPGVHLYIEFVKREADVFQDIGVFVSNAVTRLHGLHVNEVLFLSTGTVKALTSINNILQRFKLRDMILKKDSSVGILFEFHPTSRPVSEDDIPSITIGNQIYCKLCFESDSSVLDGVSWRNLEIIQEWCLYLPLNIQIFLINSFCNKNSLRKSENHQKYLNKKLAKLYVITETLLNTLNHKYTGVLQDLNTSELYINYNSVSNVFSVTSQTGITKSLKYAERTLLSVADPDLCYYKTFIKKYPLSYIREGTSSVMEHFVSMQDCHIVMSIDNLVRLTFHDDPMPGQSRSSQLCTLPITLKGMPKNMKILEEWHDQHICDGIQSCACKDTVQLKEDDMIPCLIELSAQERISWEEFEMNATWGVIPLIIYMKKTCLSDLLHESLAPPFCHEPGEKLSPTEAESWENLSEIDEVNASFSSISLEDTVMNPIRTSVTNENTHVDDINMNFSNITLGESENETDASSKDGMIFAHVLDMDQALQEEQNSLLIALDGDHSIKGKIQQVELDSRIEKPELERNSTTHFSPPPMICRHPPPAVGRDDDINKLKEVLDDVLTKTGHIYSLGGCKDRILMAPDHKIARNMIALANKDSKYEHFLLEFPMLHLRKSKITNLFSAYKDAGIQHLFMFMKDLEKEKDWTKLISITHIDAATRNIRRLSVALHCALMIKFIESLSAQQQATFITDLETANQNKVQTKWNDHYRDFITASSSQNGTFQLHVEMLQHCDEIVSIFHAERKGGPDGYDLLLSSVKLSLPFAFLNAATSYASFSVQLLHEHYSAGKFHTCMKKNLFTTPHKGGNVNLALDTQREMDHCDALKGFRPRSTLDSVLPRMSVVDLSVAMHRKRMSMFGDWLGEPGDADQTSSSKPARGEMMSFEYLSRELSRNDISHIIPTIQMILRQDALSLSSDTNVYNVYNQNKVLPKTILDKNTFNVGTYLITKYCCENQLFGMSKVKLPCLETTLSGPKTLLTKLKRSKGVTINRMKCESSSKKGTDEDKRIKKVKKEMKTIHGLSSKHNTCQAILRPDCSKQTVQKSTGIKKAILSILEPTMCMDSVQGKDAPVSLTGTQVNVITEFRGFTKSLANSIKFATVEFAGVKFKTHAASGQHYLKYVQNGIIKYLTKNLHKLETIVICEEKYTFTPDDFKSATRSSRKQKKNITIAHLRSEETMLSDTKFCKESIVSTPEGKKLISNYLALNIDKLELKNINIIVDSEASISDTCPQFSTPISATFDENGFLKKHPLLQIKQCKGEAEMAQVDWLRSFPGTLNAGDAVLALVTSADIDAVVLHMFALSLYWPRNDDQSFKNDVYIILQKQCSDIYNITQLIRELEKKYPWKNVTQSIAILLCMGGNDFLPKFHGISHTKFVKMALKNQVFFESLIEYDENKTKARINRDAYFSLIQMLYSPQPITEGTLSFDEVRQFSIKRPGVDIFRAPHLWMPPKSALINVCNLIDHQIEYMFSLWTPDAGLPDFLHDGSILKCADGTIEYYFGNDSHVANPKELINIDENTIQEKLKQSRQNKAKRRCMETPQKGKRRKRRPLTSTPKKECEAKKHLTMKSDEASVPPH